MRELGNEGRIADRYKGRGLRVIAVDKDGREHDASEAKWKAAGAGFPLYSKNGNSFATIYGDVKGYPSRLCVKEWQKKKVFSESEMKNFFGF